MNHRVALSEAQSFSSGIPSKSQLCETHFFTMRNAVVKFIGINVPLFIKLLYTAHAPEMPLPIFFADERFGCKPRLVVPQQYT